MEEQSFFNENSKTCLIEDSKFEQSKTDQNDCAICFQFKQDQAPITINRCHFIRTTSNKSGAVYIECNKDGSKSQKFVQIDSCEFTSATATDNGNSIYIIQSDLDEFAISNCDIIDCGSDSTKYSLFLEISKLNFINNHIVFNYLEQKCGCVCLQKIGSHVFRGNLFKNAQNTN